MSKGALTFTVPPSGARQPLGAMRDTRESFMQQRSVGAMAPTTTSTTGVLEGSLLQSVPGLPKIPQQSTQAPQPYVTSQTSPSPSVQPSVKLSGQTDADELSRKIEALRISSNNILSIVSNREDITRLTTLVEKVKENQDNSKRDALLQELQSKVEGLIRDNSIIIKDIAAMSEKLDILEQGAPILHLSAKLAELEKRLDERDKEKKEKKDKQEVQEEAGDTTL